MESNSHLGKVSKNCFFFIILFLIFEICCVSGGNFLGAFSSGKVLPIIIMKESNVLEIPINNASIQSWSIPLSDTTYFHANTALHERFFCAADTDNQKKLEEARKDVLNTPLQNSISENCLFEKSILGLTKNVSIMEIRCKNYEPESFISPLFKININEKNDNLDNIQIAHSSCGPRQDKKLYKYGYQLWLESELSSSSMEVVPPLTKSMPHPYQNIVDYEIYRFCYDNTTQELVYTKHTILSPDLLKNENLKEEFKPYDIEISKYDNKEIDFTKLKNIYDKMNHLNTKNNPINNQVQDTEIISKKPNLMEYKIEKLVPDEDFVFVLWKKPTFHYVNQNLMHEKLIELWKEINDLIRDVAKEHQTIAKLDIHIYTGAFDIPIEQKTDETPDDTEEIRIPEIWVKIVHLYYRDDEYEVELNQGISIIANNHMNFDLEGKISELCEVKEMYQYDSPKGYSYIRSCLVTSKIEKLFGLNLKIEGEFVISESQFQKPIIYEKEE